VVIVLGAHEEIRRATSRRVISRRFAQATEFAHFVQRHHVMGFRRPTDGRFQRC
jgi:hypothetical protein